MEKKRLEYYPRNRKEWRNWLQKNHAAAQHIWVIIYKKETGKPSVTYAEVVEEALCFGWIDSKPNKRDAESYVLFIAPRKTKSVWSALNKKRIESLLRENKIAAAGLQKIEAAKKDGSWNALDKVDAMEMPAALKKEFSKNKSAFKNFDAFPPSTKKAIYQWMASAKTETTLLKRAAETVTLAAKNIRANQWKPKQET
jgi:uncharacterized protein YdeI (YjbR/CyaY-like superfamily)